MLLVFSVRIRVHVHVRKDPVNLESIKEIFEIVLILKRGILGGPFLLLLLSKPVELVTH